MPQKLWNTLHRMRNSCLAIKVGARQRLSFNKKEKITQIRNTFTLKY